MIYAIAAIAIGALAGAAKLVENALAKSIPLIIGMLASLLGISGLAKKDQKIIQRIRKRIDKAIDKLLMKVKKFAKKFFKKKTVPAKESLKNKEQKNYAKAFAEVKALVDNPKKEFTTPKKLNKRLSKLKKKYKFKQLELLNKGKEVEIKAEINPVKIWKYGGQIRMKIIYHPSWPFDEFMSKAKAIQKAAANRKLRTLPIDPITGKQKTTRQKRKGEQNKLRKKVREYIITKVQDQKEQSRLINMLQLLEADHQVELQLMGEDKPGNLALIEGAMNNEMGWNDFRPALRSLPPNTIISSVVIDTSALEKQRKNKKKMHKTGTASLLLNGLLKYAEGGGEVVKVRSWFKLE